MNSANAKIHELRSHLEESIEVEEKLQLLFQLVRLLMFKDSAEAESYAVQATRLASKLGEEVMLVRLYLRRAIIAGNLTKFNQVHRFLKKAESILSTLDGEFSLRSQVCRQYGFYHTIATGKIALANRYYLEALRYAEKADDSVQIAESLRILGEAYSNDGYIANSVITLNAALRLYRELQYTDGVASTLSTLAIAYNAIGSDATALEYGKEVLLIYQANGNKMGELKAHFTLGMNYLGLEDYAKAREIFRKLSLQLRELQLWHPYGKAQAYVGFASNELGEHEVAEKHFDEAASALESIGNQVAIAEVQLLKAEGLVKLEKWKESIVILEEVVGQLSTPGFELGKSESYKWLADAHYGLGNIERALSYYKEHIRLESDLVSASVRRVLMSFQFQCKVDEILLDRDLFQAQEGKLKETYDIRSKELSAISLHIANNQKFLSALLKKLHHLTSKAHNSTAAIDEVVHSIESGVKRSEVWSQFAQQCNLLGKDFVNELIKSFPSLTPTELQICSLIKTNVSNIELAELMNISENTVLKHRTRIRKKLGLMRGQNLTTFLVAR